MSRETFAKMIVVMIAILGGVLMFGVTQCIKHLFII